MVDPSVTPGDPLVKSAIEQVRFRISNSSSVNRQVPKGLADGGNRCPVLAGRGGTLPRPKRFRESVIGFSPDGALSPADEPSCVSVTNLTFLAEILRVLPSTAVCQAN